MGTTWGYARVSTEDQELGLQITALRAAGVPEANIVQEKASGKVGSDRPLYAGLGFRELDEMGLPNQIQLAGSRMRIVKIGTR